MTVSMGESYFWGQPRPTFKRSGAQRPHEFLDLLQCAHTVWETATKFSRWSN